MQSNAEKTCKIIPERHFLEKLAYRSILPCSAYFNMLVGHRIFTTDVVMIQSYLDYLDSVGQTHFLVCLYNPNCLDNKNALKLFALKLSQVLLLFFMSATVPANAVLAGDISVGKPPRCYQITNFQLLADVSTTRLRFPRPAGGGEALRFTEDMPSEVREEPTRKKGLGNAKVLLFRETITPLG